jgi:membrane protein
MLVSARESYEIVKDAIVGFFADDAVSHSAAMAFFAVTALSPVLLIVVAIAGLVFGHDAAEVALSAQLSGLMGPQSAELMETALRSAQDTSSGVMVAAVGVVTLLVTASGVFGEMQTTLNKIWKVEPLPVSLSTLVRARAASLGLVAALGFLLLVSLAATAAISVLGDFITAHLPLGEMILQAINAVVSLTLITLLFAAIYKVLPDRTLQWRDVMFGSFVTALLFTIGKTLIGLYLGSSNVASSYGAAGGLLIILLWLFYSSIIFLLGAELTRAYSIRHGSRHDLRAELGSRPVATEAVTSADLAVPNDGRHVVTTRRFPGVPDSTILAGLTAVALFSAGLTMLRRRR